MDKYIIQQGYPDCMPGNEIEIVSENLRYAEIAELSGVQCMNPSREDEIHKRCAQISKLIKEIDELNKL